MGAAPVHTSVSPQLGSIHCSHSPKLGAADPAGGRPAAPTGGLGWAPGHPGTFPAAVQSAPCVPQFPLTPEVGSPPPHKAMLPLPRRARPAAGRMQPSGDPHPTATWGHPTRKEGPGEGVSLPTARPAAGRRLPVRWQQGTAVSPPGWQQHAGSGPGMLSGGGGMPGSDPRSPPPHGDEASSCPLALGPPPRWAHKFYFRQKTVFQPQKPTLVRWECVSPQENLPVTSQESSSHPALLPLGSCIDL